MNFSMSLKLVGLAIVIEWRPAHSIGKQPGGDSGLVNGWFTICYDLNSRPRLSYISCLQNLWLELARSAAN